MRTEREVAEREVFMAKSRKDPQGRKLRDGESYRKEGRYSYRYTDKWTGKRRTVYAQDLPELREKEKQIAKDMEDNILTDSAIRKMTLNTLFERYMATRKLAASTRSNYIGRWNNHVKDEIGNMKVVQILPSDIKAFYNRLSEKKYAKSTIKLIHNLLHPALEMAVDDKILRENPAKGTFGDYGKEAEEKEALTREQQERFLDFVKHSGIYNIYYPMFVIMIETALRCGELIGLTWDDVDIKKGKLSINHQLTYRNNGEGCRFYITEPKTSCGYRTIPMTELVKKAFKEQKEINFMLAKDKSIEVDGYSGFIFTAKSGRPLMPAAVNSVLYNIVAAYNKEEARRAKEEHRKAELLPKFSAHVLRHTGCTRMAEAGMDVKVLQYIMGHARIEITMKVYNHLGDGERLEREIAKLDKLAANY